MGATDRNLNTPLKAPFLLDNINLSTDRAQLAPQQLWATGGGYARLGISREWIRFYGRVLVCGSGFNREWAALVEIW